MLKILVIANIVTTQPKTNLTNCSDKESWTVTNSCFINKPFSYLGNPLRPPGIVMEMEEGVASDAESDSSSSYEYTNLPMTQVTIQRRRKIRKSVVKKEIHQVMKASSMILKMKCFQ